MRNTIYSYIDGELDEIVIDQALPFEGKEVKIRSVSHLLHNVNHWLLSLQIEINNCEKTLTKVTTDSYMIENWDGLTEKNDDSITYIGKLAAIEDVLIHNIEELLKFAETDE